MTCFGKDYLVLQDYYSKWLEILPISSKSAQEVIAILKIIFSTHGIPKFACYDNIPFNSFDFHKFAKLYDFEIVFSSPHYARSNGQAARAVQTAKKILKKSKETDTDLAICLLEYSNLPISGIDLSPAQILFSRRTRTKLPVHSELLKPKIDTNAHNKITNNQLQYKYSHDRHSKPFNYQLKEGENAISRTVHDNTWEPVQINHKHDKPRSFEVINQKGNIVRRTTNNLKSSNTPFVTMIYCQKIMVRVDNLQTLIKAVKILILHILHKMLLVKVRLELRMCRMLVMDNQ